MRNFHLARIAVNLSLIVALAIQPVAACAVAADCSLKCSASDILLCPGCGCCEVEQANDRCCCCSGTAKVVEEEAAKPSCCSRDESADAEVFDASSSDLDTLSTACKLSEPDESELGLQSVCLCDQSSQPLNDPSPPRPANESRTGLAIGYAGPVAADFDDQLSRTAALDATGAPALAHFTQIVLCIWRL